jgi:hypothetical protein
MGAVAMPCAVTVQEIDELEEMLVRYHNGHSSEFGLILEICNHPVCVDANLGIAWLRSQLILEDVRELRRRQDEESCGLLGAS